MIGFLDVEQLTENYRQCRLYTKHYAKTFYFASHVLPGRKRPSTYALYAFCRYADELADSGTITGNGVQAQRRLNELRNQIRYVYTSSPLMDTKLVAFRDTVLRYGIPQEYFLDLLRGVEMDLTVRIYRTFAELKEYCYCVASVVGLMMTKIFGVSSTTALQHAEDLGTAMQLTNILRDIGEDSRRGRVYLPLDELDRFGYSVEELHAGVLNDNFRRLMQFQIGRAREYYRRAELGIPMLTNDGSRFCVSLMSRTYEQILDAIEQNGYDVFQHRAFVPAGKKILIALSSRARTVTDHKVQSPKVTRYATTATVHQH